MKTTRWILAAVLGLSGLVSGAALGGPSGAPVEPPPPGLDPVTVRSDRARSLRAIPAERERRPGSAAFAARVRLETGLPDGAAISLAAGDFNEDGVADLVVGHLTPEGGALTLHRGNLRAIYTHSTAGAVGPPFDPPGPAVAIERRPDFLVAGDFDNDGTLDVVVGSRGEASISLWSGDGRSGLSFSEHVSLPGRLTGLSGGEINRADGLTDLAVGIDGPSGAAVLVFEGPNGALRHGPETILLPSTPRSLHSTSVRAGIAGLRIETDDGGFDIEGRDRRLSAAHEQRETVDPPRVQAATAIAGPDPLPSGFVAALPLRLNPDGLEDLVAIDAAGDLFVLPSAVQATIVVDSGLDSLVAGDGACTLREAIGNANLDGDASGGDCAAGAGADEIHFAIGGGGAAASIVLESTLPAISGTTTLDGTTQNCGQPPCVEIDGSLTIAADGLMLTGDDSVIRGLAINNLGNSAIRIQSAGCIVEGNHLGLNLAGTQVATNFDGVLLDGAQQTTIGGTVAAARNVISASSNSGVTVAASSQTTILGNYLGHSADGSTPILGNEVGVEIRDGSIDTLIGGPASTRRNVIGNNQLGILIVGAGSGTQVQGNYVGTDLTGTLDRGNAQQGIRVEQTSGCTIGGTAVGAGNLISGNNSSGFAQFGDSVHGGSLIQGNLIGTDATGSQRLRNGGSGVYLDSSPDNLVGGTAATAMNVVSGNDGSGIIVDGSGSTGVVILGNHVGVDISGTVAIGNDFSGIASLENVNGLTIGGTESGARNVVSGNAKYGVFVYGDNQRILGNYIGTNVTGTTSLANGNSGVGLGFSNNSIVGGTTAGARNVISGNAHRGVAVFHLPSGGDGNVIQGNYIGTDATGSQAVPNGLDGITLDEGPSDTLIGGTVPGAGNVISANAGNGIRIEGYLGDNNRIQGNHIGVDAAGTSALGNTQGGIRVLLDAKNTIIGGPEPGAGNVISGNGSVGVSLVGAGAGTRIQGNIVGLDAAGAIPVGNAAAGIIVQETPEVLIGGTVASERNVISANGNANVEFLAPLSSGGIVQGNYIGTDSSGTIGMFNNFGVRIKDVSDVLIGGAESGAGNLISGNAFGVTISEFAGTAQHNVIAGNLIGTDATGTSAVPNGIGVRLDNAGMNTVGGVGPFEHNVISGNSGPAIVLQPGADGNVIVGNLIGVETGGASPLPNGGVGVFLIDAGSSKIGGVLPGEGNVIAWSGEEGVRIQAGSRNTILGNSIYGSGLLGIDLGASDGVTANDELDSDLGPNGLQNYPTLFTAAATASDVTIGGGLSTRPDSTFRVEFFAGPACHPSGYGEGTRVLGITSVATDTAGNAAFNLVLSESLSNGEAITATATDSSGNTSEFSACIAAECATQGTLDSTLVAQDGGTLAWAGAQDVRYVVGDLATVLTYAYSVDGTLFGASALDISADTAAPGAGRYYLVRPLGCGSWQTSAGMEPARDRTLP